MTWKLDEILISVSVKKVFYWNTAILIGGYILPMTASAQQSSWDRNYLVHKA